MKRTTMKKTPSTLNKLVRASCLGTLISLLAACQNGINHEAAGTLVGGIAGGLLGSQVGGGSGKVLATVGGAIVGAVVGNSIGHHMDDVDQMKLTQTLERGQSGKTTTWTNPDEQVTYSVTPKRATLSNNGQPCREYTLHAIIGGKPKEVYGTACRDAAGDWKIRN
jgi:surface antigen